MSATDKGLGAAMSPDAPASDAYAITPHDTNDVFFGGLARGLFVGVGGDLCCDFGADRTSVVFKNVPSGSVLPIRPSRVRATSTTATNILALL